jgi:hypothetical protein
MILVWSFKEEELVKDINNIICQMINTVQFKIIKLIKGEIHKSPKVIISLS